jgi:hypothetical protein
MAWSHASFSMRAPREGPPKHTDECRRYRESEKARKLASPPITFRNKEAMTSACLWRF